MSIFCKQLTESSNCNKTV